MGARAGPGEGVQKGQRGQEGRNVRAEKLALRRDLLPTAPEQGLQALEGPLLLQTSPSHTSLSPTPPSLREAPVTRDAEWLTGKRRRRLNKQTHGTVSGGRLCPGLQDGLADPNGKGLRVSAWRF